MDDFFRDVEELLDQGFEEILSFVRQVEAQVEGRSDPSEFRPTVHTTTQTSPQTSPRNSSRTPSSNRSTSSEKSGADLALLTNQAALEAIRRFRQQGLSNPSAIQITTDDFAAACDRLSSQRQPN